MLLTRDLEMFQVLGYISRDLSTYIHVEDLLIGTTLDPKVNIDLPGYACAYAYSSI